MTERPEMPLSSDARASLLTSARRAYDRGNSVAARAVLHALVVRAPEDVQAWLLLASVAENQAEQQHAFERALALDPSNNVAQQGLAQLRPAPRAESPVGAAVQLGSTDFVEVEPAHEQARWPLYSVLGVALAILLLAALWLWQPKSQPTAGLLPAGPLPTLAAQQVGDTTSTAAPAEVPPTAPVAPSPAAPTSAPDVVAATSPVIDAPTPAPIASPNPAPPTVPIGQIATEGPWHVGLMRPTDALVLSGSINQLQPQGRFVMALVAVSNTAPGDQLLPTNLLELKDASGNRYRPIPAASTAYIAAFGAGQAGILSMEQAIPNGGGIVSIPVIFDVPPDARGLQLIVGNAGDGWQIGQ